MSINLTTKIACSTLIISALAGCAGTQVSKYNYDETLSINTPQKSEKCYDASILVSENLTGARDISKKVVIALDSTIAEEKENYIKADRNRHVGLMVGSGGEEIFVNLKKIDERKTFITVTTKTGFVGAAGQKPWSCKIVDEIAKMAG
ncbi:hypothetical protein OLMES_0509 [Oleiphilus messinensis]|uniref:Lipoprotein n=1 Tax=Oleiphilus messinensis TaxID=141451 RepID=A0A1Y0I2B7_9GAMM|nr:hypothetical protein [Oleiphilus messinensis]ARU54612.1 hypothetical protein OLMES_0509 [Oleiphilus messinensis]